MRNISFDTNFEFGVATASYQIEGAWNVDGKGESNWDRFCHTPGKIEDGTTADDACDFYHRYEEDIKIAADLGFKVFRLSVSWARIFPNGTGEVNRKGVEFYRDVLTEIKKNNMKVSLTTFHWDLPQALQNRGGWANREIVDWYADYAKTLFAEYKDLVDYWITFNEPYNPTMQGYWYGTHAPGYQDYSLALQTVHNMLLAHGVAVKEFRKLNLNSEIGITLNMNKAYPADSSNQEDVNAAKRLEMQNNNLFGDPVWLGSYPKELFDYLETKGVVLPDIQPGDMELIHQELDFFGLNNYFADIVKHDENNWPINEKLVMSGKPLTDADWEVWPRGFYDLLMWINESYHPAKLIITENGAATNDWVNSAGEVEDVNRIEYFKGYLAAVYDAKCDGVPIEGYYAWSLLDNFEWAWGLKRRFGIVYVDYESKERIVKKSGYWFKEMMEKKNYELEM